MVEARDETPAHPYATSGTRDAMAADAPRWAVTVALSIVLGVSLGLRLVLARRGGQYFWLDESHRFHPCIQVIDELLNGRFLGALDMIAPNHGHMGFFFIAIPVAGLYHWISGYSGFENLWVPAAILSVASVIAIWLIYLIARKAGADRIEALLAATFMATANSMFYYSRHLTSYDSGLALVLLLLWLALDDRSSFRRSVLFGLVAGLASLTYYGYLTTVLAIGAVWAFRSPSLRAFFTRALGSALGFAFLPLLLQALTLWREATPFFLGYARFVVQASQGDYAEGWRVTWEYLWHAEHAMLLLWAAGALGAFAFWLTARADDRAAVAAARRGALWLTLAAIIYAMLAVNSTVLHKSVVLGRFARQLVPFLSLATATALVQLVRGRRGGPAIIAVVVAFAVVQGALNFRRPLAQRFPIEVDRTIVAQLAGGNLAREITIMGPEEFTDVGTAVEFPSRYLLLNTATFLYPPKGPKPTPARGAELFRSPHPLEFLPYQYELMTPDQREVLRSTDISMRLIDTTVAGTDSFAR